MSGKLKTPFSVAAIGCIVLLDLFAPASALAADKTTWAKYNNAVSPGTSDTTNWGSGRIPVGTSGKGDDAIVQYQAVIKDGSTNKMWYSGHDGAKWRIYYATSLNGLTWMKYDNNTPGNSDSICTNGTIALGTAGKGDQNGVCGPAVIKDNSTYKMWYSASDSGNKWRIYYATSSNGLTWTKYSNSVPDASNTTGTYGRIPLGTSGKGDDKSASQGTVIKVGSVYKMWYTGQDAAGSTNRVYYATSTDGLTWKKYDNSIPAASDTTSTNGCVPSGITGGDIKGALRPCVIKDGYTYKMWYSGKDVSSNWRIYHATLDALPEGTIFYGH